MAVETGKGKAPVNTKAQPSVEVKAIELKPLEFRFLRETVNTLVFSEMLASTWSARCTWTRQRASHRTASSRSSSPTWPSNQRSNAETEDT
jgi:hypothetical protein